MLAETRIVEQSKLTSDCFFVQVFGLSRCEVCEFRDTDECGGKEIIEKIKAGRYPVEGIGRKP